MAETTTTLATLAGNVYSEAQHFSLLESALERETAALTAEKSELEARVKTLESQKAAAATELSEAKTQIDVLEAAKVTAEATAETARTELATFKTEITRTAQIEELKGARTAAVKAANANLAETFFSDERVIRWAEMSDVQFASLVEDITDAAKEAATAPLVVDVDTTTDKARQTAAFTGGVTPPSAAQGSTLATLLGSRRALQH